MMKTPTSPAYVADFDSASAMLRATAQYLHGHDFPQLGVWPALQPLTQRIAWTVDALPPRLRTWMYTVTGALEALPPERLGEVRAEDMARWAVDSYPRRQYPAAVVGSSNGAATHLWAAMGIPWLPQTLLIPVKAQLHVDHPKVALEQMRGPARALLDANSELELHHMRDPSQDRLMLHNMTYFRVKRLRLGTAYERFLEESLAPGATIFVTECQQPWPTTRVDERHYFQQGAVGGVTTDEYFNSSARVARFLYSEHSPLAGWDAPTPDAVRPEAEWGFAPALRDDLERLARRRGYRLRRIVFQHPMEMSPLVTDLFEWWYARQGIAAQRLLATTFILLDPYWTLRTRSLPYWMTFNMEPSAQALEAYLKGHAPFDDIYLTLFSHGVRSIGLATIERWRALLDRARRRGKLLGVNPRAYPLDFATFARYHPAMQREISARYPLPDPLTLQELDAFLAQAGSRYAVQWLEDSVLQTDATVPPAR